MDLKNRTFPEKELSLKAKRTHEAGSAVDTSICETRAGPNRPQSRMSQD